MSTLTERPIPKLVKKWIEGEDLTPKEIEILRNEQKSADIRVRESCRILLAAILGQTEAEPHAQNLAKQRTLNRFRSKIQVASSHGETRASKKKLRT